MSIPVGSFRALRRYVGPIQGIVLDWAGTTMDFGCLAPPAAFIEAYRRHGIDITMDEARLPMGAHKLVHIRRIGQIPRVADAWRAVHGHTQSEADVERIFEVFVPIQLDILPRFSDLVPGTLEAVAAMRARAYERLYTAGAHYVVDGIWDVMPVLEAIEQRVRHGERP